MRIDQFVIDGQDPKLVEKLLTKVQDMLTSGEYIQYIAVQKKPAVTILPDSITVSNKRIFLCEFTKLGLATDFEIISWENIKDINLKEEIFGSKVTVIPQSMENLSIDYIPKVQARKVYQLVKESLEQLGQIPLGIEHPLQKIFPEVIQEIEAEEPLFSTDEVFVPSQPEVEQVEELEADEEDELTQRLQKLKKLYDKQLITQAEYENKKSELLSQI